MESPNSSSNPGKPGFGPGDTDELMALLLGRGLNSLALSDLKRLLSLVGEQYASLFAEKKQIALVGPVNTGKSSLYNALIGAAQPKAQVSPVPGTTRTNQTGDADVFAVIDTPGANETEVAGEGSRGSAERRQEAMEAAQRADMLVIVFDAGRGIAHDEMSIYQELEKLNKPTVVVLNKIDLVKSDRDAAVESAAHNLQLPVEKIIATSATKGTNLSLLLLALVEADADVLTTLADVMPNARWLLATRTIMAASIAAATANLVTSPFEIPLASFMVITPIQIGMTLNLARIYGHGLTPGRAKELAVAFGSAMLGRRIFYYLVDLVPAVGWVLGTAVAAGSTMALGYGLATWFAGGEKLSKTSVRGMAEEISRTLLDGFKQYPEKGSLRENIPAMIGDTWKRIGDIAAQYQASSRAKQAKPPK
jgi:small GTP-binding protein